MKPIAEHDDRGNDGAERDNGSERNQRSADERRGDVGERARSAEAAEVRHHQQPEASEDGEGGDLQVADHQQAEREDGGIDDRCPGCAVQGHAAGVGAPLGGGTRGEGATSATAGTVAWPVIEISQSSQDARGALQSPDRAGEVVGRIRHSARPSPPLGTIILGGPPRRLQHAWR